MPIKIDGKKMDFDEAVRYIMNKKGLSKERASAYVATVESKQLDASLRMARLRLAGMQVAIKGVSGEKFKRTVKKIEDKGGARDPEAVAAVTLRKKYEGKMNTADYATTMRGKRKFPIGSKQDRLLHTKKLPHSHVMTNDKRIIRYDSGPSSKKS